MPGGAILGDHTVDGTVNGGSVTLKVFGVGEGYTSYAGNDQNVKFEVFFNGVYGYGAAGIVTANFSSGQATGVFVSN